VPRKRGPKEAHKLTREMVEFLQQIRQEDPSLRSADLTERVAKRFGVAGHPRTIERGRARQHKKRRKPVRVLTTGIWPCVTNNSAVTS
jgi:hypothetical protein